MRFRILSIVMIMMLPITPSWASENTAKTLLIADTGFSDSDLVIAAHTVAQICIMDWYACPNGLNFQESGTAAMLTSGQMQGSGFSHGSKMARAAIAAYPDVKLVLVRIVGQFSNGNRMSTSESVITKVLTWANKNSATYNIGAIAISQGSSKSGSNARKCFSSAATEREISSLRAKGIFSFFPAGNEGKSDSINWPACIPDSIAVGALDKSGVISRYSNFADGQVDIYEAGYNIDPTINSTYREESGTSYSAQYAAARWLSLVNRFPNAKPALIYWNFSFSGEIVENSKGQTGWGTSVESTAQTLEGR